MMASESIHPAHKRVLVIDGGGFRGLGCLLVIQKIMDEVATRSRRSLLPCQVFDLVCGTSTGGLVAILLGRMGLDCLTAIQIYKMITDELIGHVEQDFWDRLIKSSRFDSNGFDAALEDLVITYGGDASRPMMLPSHTSDPIPHEDTKTFVTIGADAPDYSNRTYHVRSYQTPKRGSPSSPPGYEWSIREAARATAAEDMWMPPLLIKHNTLTYGFRDAAALGFNNPTDLARREAERLWPDEQVGVVISLGTGLSSLAPVQPTRAWTITDKYADPLVDEILSRLSSLTAREQISRESVMAVVKKLVSIAVDTKLVHVNATATLPEHDVYYRIDAPLPLRSTDLVDCFCAEKVEESVNTWLDDPERTAEIRKIASKLVKLEEGPLTVEQAKIMQPPPPPPDTNPGYNPQLDKRRPETMIDYLQKYHVLFVVDDSSSMGTSRWGEARDALAGIAAHAVKHDATRIDMRFLNSLVECLGVQDASTIVSAFNQVIPYGYTPTGAVLERILEAHITKLDHAVGTPEYRNKKPLDIIVITDGSPSDDPSGVLVDAAMRLKSSKHHPNCIGIQFVQIGNDEAADKALNGLAHGTANIGNMVDTVPYTGELTPQRLERILLGGLHPSIRALLPVT